MAHSAVAKAGTVAPVSTGKTKYAQKMIMMSGTPRKA